MDVIGRDEELATLGAFLHEGNEFPRALLLEGEPGIGKTTLWQRAVWDGRRRGYVALACSPGGSEAQLAFAALRDLLDPVYEAVVPSLPPPQRQALDMALLRAEVGETPPQRGAVAAGLLGALRALATREPVLVAVDDIQWLDRSTAATLEFVFRRLADARVAVVVARRPSPSSSVLGLERALPAGRLTEVAVGPLSLGAVHRLLGDRLGVTFARPTLVRLHELSGGNPFFALEVGRALQRRGGRVAAGEALPVPAELQQLVRERLETLPQATLEALQFAAGLSRPTVALVLSASETDAASLDPAVEANVVEIHDGRLSFTHPLLASSAYAMLMPARRRAVHQRLAGVISDPEERARQLALAAEGPDASVATALEQAATAARTRGARASAAELFEQAARLTPPELASEVRGRKAEAGYLHFEAGDSRRGRGILEALAAELPPGSERARVLIRLGYTRAYDDDLHAATELLLQAEREAEEDEGIRAEALSTVAGMLFRRRERLTEAAEHAKKAVRLARGIGGPTLLADALGQLLLVEATLGRPEARATLENVMQLQEATKGARLLSQPQWSAAIACMWWEELEWARQAYEEVLDRGRQSGEDALLPYVYILAAQNECLLGVFERGASYAETGREMAEQAGEETLASYALAVGAVVDAHRGRADATREAGRHALEVARRTRGTPTLFFAAAGLGLLELSLGRPKEAAAHLEPIVAHARREGLAEPGMTRFIPDYAEALIELRALEEAEDVLGPYEEQARRVGRRGALGSALRCRGLLAASRGDVDGAIAIMERALVEHRAAPLPFEHARTLLAHGTTLRRARQKRAAREALGHARRRFQRLGADAWVARADQELARISGRTRSDRGLTPTEHRVAALVAQGLSTKEVAAALFVSPKTVEGHLSKIYGKLGVRSRAELASSFASVDSEH